MMNSSNFVRSYDRYEHRADGSTTHKLKNAYWTTKQAVLSKIGKKEDEHIVASDSYLDSKLELFKSVQTTCNDLNRHTEKFIERMCALSQAESEMGRFLKQYSVQDKTKAGEIMAVTGKSLSYTAQQRLTLRQPLMRLAQEVETFRLRAIGDSLDTIKRMESKRTDYRGALRWMKHVSEELDPDTHKQLDKFRKVQAQVRSSKESFDKLKVDSMQKIDLLAASRSNMLSHALVAYQNAFLLFWEKTAKTMGEIEESFKGYQYYEFSMLKELTEETKKLATTDDDDDDSRRGEQLPSSDVVEAKEDDDSNFDTQLVDIFQDLDVNRPTSRQNTLDLLGLGGDQLLPGERHSSETDADLMNNDAVPREDKDLLADIFGNDIETLDSSHKGVPNYKRNFSSLFDAPVEGQQTSANSDPFDMFNLNSTTNSSQQPHPDGGIMPSQNNPKKIDTQNTSSVDSWMNLFSELGPMGNPDKLSKKAEDIEEI